jgi:hypothetical protein
MDHILHPHSGLEENIEYLLEKKYIEFSSCLGVFIHVLHVFPRAYLCHTIQIKILNC